MLETSPARREHGTAAPLLHKRLERFVRRHVNPPIALDAMFALSHHPNRFHTLAGLEHPVAAPLSDVDRAASDLEHWGLTQTRRRGDDVRVSLSRSPVVVESAVSPLTRMSRRDIEERLDELVEEGVIDCRRDGAMSLYALTPDVSIRKAVEELPPVDPSERSHLLRHPVRQRAIRDHRHDSETTPNVTEDTLEGGTP
jgi:hypothetical protein